MSEADVARPVKPSSAVADARGPIPVPAKLHNTSGDRGVVECYSGPFHRIVFKGAGLPSYNEGRYADNPTRPHKEALRVQDRKMLDLALTGEEGGEWKGARPPRMLDLGCGNGELMGMATSMGVEVVGITLIPEQVEECRRRGLNAYLLNYRDIGPEWEGLFDCVIMKGCVEHFVQPPDVLAGRDVIIYHELFGILANVLDPASPSGRVVNSTIKYNRRPAPRDLIKSPLEHPIGSDAYHYAMLNRMYSGWHPAQGELAERATPYFDLEREEDTTQDYLISSEYALNVIRRAWVKPRMWKEALTSLALFPRSTLVHAWGLYVSQSTNWYFRGPNPPCGGQLQTWRRAR